MGERQLDRIFNGYHPFLLRDESSQCIQQGCLPGCFQPRDNDIHAGCHTCLQELQYLAAQRIVLHQVSGRKSVCRRFLKDERRPVYGNRWKQDSQAAAILQTHFLDWL